MQYSRFLGAELPGKGLAPGLQCQGWCWGWGCQPHSPHTQGLQSTAGVLTLEKQLPPEGWSMRLPWNQCSSSADRGLGSERCSVLIAVHFSGNPLFPGRFGAAWREVKSRFVQLSGARLKHFTLGVQCMPHVLCQTRAFHRIFSV